MAETRLKATVSRLTNLGNFENVKIEATVEADLPNGVGVQEKMKKLYEECRMAVVVETANHLKAGQLPAPKGAGLNAG